MKKLYLNVALCFSLGVFAACSNDTEELMNAAGLSNSVPELQIKNHFPVPDGAKKLNGTPAENLRDLFKAAGSEVMTTLGSVEITDEEYAEIKAFTDELVGNQRTDVKKYQGIFSWVSKNVKYGQSDNRAYPVFKNKKGVCQGYSNLLTVMCHTQGIPATIVNGMLDPLGGHAWVYVAAGTQWVVSDPTNSSGYSMNSTSSYTHLIPFQADTDFFEDETGIYHFYTTKLNLREVKHAEGNILTVPYSVGGFVINSFNPLSPLPNNITEVYLGSNIESLGESPIGLVQHGSRVEAVHVDEANPVLMSHKGVVYLRNGGYPQLHFIPSAMTTVELMPMEVAYKNTIYNQMSVEEIIFPEGTKRLEDYAIENCPRLKRVYVPTDCEVSSRALYNVPPTVEIIRGLPSGIVHVRI